MKREQEISLGGFGIFGALTLIMVIIKLTMIDSWSWWRGLLPIGLFVGFNLMSMAVGFIYLTLARIPERADGDEAAIMAPHEFSVHHVASMAFFILFADNAVRWLEANDDSYWFWLFSGESQTMLLFGVLSVIAQFWYWSTLGALVQSDSSLTH